MPSFGDSKAALGVVLHETNARMKINPIKKWRIDKCCCLIELIILFDSSKEPKSTVNQAQCAKNQSKIIVNIQNHVHFEVFGTK
jgi:hypothetical protein